MSDGITSTRHNRDDARGEIVRHSVYQVVPLCAGMLMMIASGSVYVVGDYDSSLQDKLDMVKRLKIKEINPPPPPFTLMSNKIVLTVFRSYILLIPPPFFLAIFFLQIIYGVISINVCLTTIYLL